MDLGKLLTLNQEEQLVLWSLYQKLIRRTRIMELDNYIQHGTTSTLKHTIAVTYYSLLFIKRFHIRCNEESLIIGALFHDYFLYDWHVKDRTHRWHGFFHPKTAYENAIRDFEINEIETDIIRKHMFPLTVMLPRYKETVVVSLVDKICSTYEIFSKQSYEKLMDELAENIYQSYFKDKDIE